MKIKLIILSLAVVVFAGFYGFSSKPTKLKSMANLVKHVAAKSKTYQPKEVALQLDKDLQSKGLSLDSPIFIRIFKQESALEVWVQNAKKTYTLFESHPICYFSGDLGPKLKEGDGQAPEGFYSVAKWQMNPKSRYHLSFNLGYPNAYDEAHGRTGSYLMVHGNCVSIGCYAMTDPVIERIFTLANKAFDNDQRSFKAHIFPFRMTDDNLNQHQNLKWFLFWKQLQPAYTWFEAQRTVPEVIVRQKSYVVVSTT